MSTMIIGLILFLGIHLLPDGSAAAPSRWSTGWARTGTRAVFSLASAVGLVLIVVGYAHSGRE